MDVLNSYYIKQFHLLVKHIELKDYTKHKSIK